MKRFQVSRALWISLLVTLAAGPALAQSNAEVNAAVQFNFSNPGARSLGLGGAFIGLADDATAAYTNPAGLTNLSKPEVSFEGRYFLYRNDFLDSGHALGTPSGMGTDTVAGGVRSRTHDVSKSFSFLSFVYPQERWAVAVYRHELANFQTKFQTNGAFLTPPGKTCSQSDSSGCYRLFPAQASLDLKIIEYGASVAVRFGGFSLGVGVTSSQYAQTSQVTRFNFPSSSFDKATYTSINSIDFIDGSASEHVTVNAGLLWKATRNFWVGAVYRQGPKFHNQVSVFDAVNDNSFFATGTFHVPDVYGVGVTLKPTDSFTACLDFNRILYSQLTKEFVDIFNDDGNGNLLSTKDFHVDDGNVYRLGLQYVVPLGDNSLALRAGAWRDPDHHVRFTGTVVDPQSAANSLLFQPGKDEYHYTGGLGFTLGEHFQVDAAADIATSVRTGSVSAVVRF
jgi:long-chain fatty acid transport protein